jgi:hypothetical protein
MEQSRNRSLRFMHKPLAPYQARLELIEDLALDRGFLQINVSFDR